MPTLDDTIATERRERQELNRQRREAVRGWCEGSPTLVTMEWACDDCANDIFVIDGNEYLVYTAEEVRAACKERIEETLWSFNADFLADKTGVDSKVFRVFGSLHEVANGPIRSLIDAGCGWGDFIDAALLRTPAPHLLGADDGVEYTHTDENGRLWFFYRINW